MRVLEYVRLDARRVAAAYAKVRAALSRGDFSSAEVKKLTGHTRLYRARLDHSNRLLFTLVRAGGQVCVLNLEIIHQHAYENSRLLPAMATGLSGTQRRSSTSAPSEVICGWLSTRVVPG